MILTNRVAYCDGGHCEPQKRIEFEGGPDSVPRGWAYVTADRLSRAVLCCTACTAHKVANGAEGVVIPGQSEG